MKKFLFVNVLSGNPSAMVKKEVFIVVGRISMNVRLVLDMKF